LEEKKMKRFTFLFLSLLVAMSMALAACQPTATPTVEEPVEEPAEVEEPTEEPVVEEILEEKYWLTEHDQKKVPLHPGETFASSSARAASQRSENTTARR